LRSSIELWVRFLWFAIQRLFVFRSPLVIADSDELARALFSGHVKKSGALRPNAFLINTKSEYGISVHRWTLAPVRFFRSLAMAAAMRRKVNFKGFAKFEAGILSSISPSEGATLKAYGVPTLDDPFHADIPLARDEGEDYYLLIATELSRKAQPVA
jgi:hypothetical protein